MQINIIIVILLIIVIVLLIKSNNDRLSIKKQQDNLNKEINQLSYTMASKIENSQYQVSGINQSIDNKLAIVTDQNTKSLNMVSQNIEQKVSNHNLETMTQLKNTIANLEEKLNNQSKDSQAQIKEVIAQISKLETVSGQINGLNDTIVNLNAILNDKKARGTFGEIRLQQILEAVFGVNQELWDRQVKLSNDKLVDFIIYAPEPIAKLCIDSKFPLENYQKMTDSDDITTINEATKLFKADIKKHINDIQSKYIIDGETANQAIMFIPSEAIYHEIYANHNDLITYSFEQKVWITSPTTLMAIVNILLGVIKDVKRSEKSQEIKQELVKLGDEFSRFEKRWQTLNKDVEKLANDTKLVDTTTSKIVKRFNEITEAEI